jgi:hypothetical protein
MFFANGQEFFAEAFYLAGERPGMLVRYTGALKSCLYLAGEL